MFQSDLNRVLTVVIWYNSLSSITLNQQTIHMYTCTYVYLVYI